jgi:hypothetical protein
MSDILSGGTTEKTTKETIIEGFNLIGYEVVEINKQLIIKDENLITTISILEPEVIFTMVRTMNIKNLFEIKNKKIDFLFNKKIIWKTTINSFDEFYTQNLTNYLPNKSL